MYNENSKDSIIMVPNFKELQLCGSQGILPLHYTERLLDLPEGRKIVSLFQFVVDNYVNSSKAFKLLIRQTIKLFATLSLKQNIHNTYLVTNNYCYLNKNFLNMFFLNDRIALNKADNYCYFGNLNIIFI